jgi:hypothetical protein
VTRKVEGHEIFFHRLDDLKGESVVVRQKGIVTGLNRPATIDRNEAIFIQD